MATVEIVLDHDLKRAGDRGGAVSWAGRLAIGGAHGGNRDAGHEGGNERTERKNSGHNLRSILGLTRNQGPITALKVKELFLFQIADCILKNIGDVFILVTFLSIILSK